MIELKIDDTTIEAQKGETVLQAALRHGIEIPHFCYHPCLSIAGNCRICLVKIDDRPKLMPACNLEVAPGMNIFTNSDDVKAARQAVMQFITLNHPGECGICDKAGECRVQDYQERYGASTTLSIEPKMEKAKFDELSDRILLDTERCVLCSRCVRFTREISGSQQLGIVGRGNHSHVQATACFDDPYSDNVIGICPAGAMLSKPFLYKTRTWFLEEVSSTCPGCERGCSINVWRRKKEWHVSSLDPALNRAVYRITPRTNPSVNGEWICNKGFDLAAAEASRLTTALVRGSRVDLDEGIEEAKRLLRSAKYPAVIISNDASNEELDAFRSLLAEAFEVYTAPPRAAAAGEVVEDQLLIRADKSANRAGVLEVFDERPFTAGARHDLLLLWGDLPAGISTAGIPVIRLTAEEPAEMASELAADLYLPLPSHFERSGSFCNFQGTSVSFDRVFEPPAGVIDTAELFRRLAP